MPDTTATPVGSRWRRNGTNARWTESTSGAQRPGTVSPYTVRIVAGHAPGFVRYEPEPSGPPCQSDLSAFLEAFDRVEGAHE